MNKIICYFLDEKYISILNFISGFKIDLKSTNSFDDKRSIEEFYKIYKTYEDNFNDEKIKKIQKIGNYFSYNEIKKLNERYFKIQGSEDDILDFFYDFVNRGSYKNIEDISKVIETMRVELKRYFRNEVNDELFVKFISEIIFIFNNYKDVINFFYNVKANRFNIIEVINFLFKIDNEIENKELVKYISFVIFDTSINYVGDLNKFYEEIISKMNDKEFIEKLKKSYSEIVRLKK